MISLPTPDSTSKVSTLSDEVGAEKDRAFGDANNLTAPMAKWGLALDGGQVLPDLLLKHQRDLKLTTTDMVVLLNLTMAWLA